ncbi:hypothetical protein Efla_005041 [Eimeria flavescens]
MKADHEETSPRREAEGLRQRRTEGFDCSFSTLDSGGPLKKKGDPRAPPPRRRSLLRALAGRNKVTLILFFCCAAILIHGILTCISKPPPGVVPLEPLEGLAKKAAAKGSNGEADKNQGSLYLLGGAPLVDSVDWLNVSNLGFEEVTRGNGTLGGVTYDPMLWDPSLIGPDGRNPREPLPTNSWFSPFVIPPGQGDMHVVNSAPYLLSVRTKPRGRTDLVGDTAGLTVRGPLLVVDATSEGGTYGLRQSAGPVGFGFFVGIRLRDYGDEVVRHYVANPSPLSFEKVWEIKRFHEDENEMVDATRVVLQTMRALVVRGAPFLTMELPVGQKLLLETLPADINAGRRNAVERILNFSGHPTEATHTCTSLMAKPMESDAFEVDLSDGTQWIAVMSRKASFSCIQMTCEPGKTHHRLLSVKVLKEPLIVRLALSSLCDHEIVRQKRVDSAAFPSLFYGIEELCPPDQSQVLSRTRWKFMTLFNVLPSRSLADAIQFLGRKGPGKIMFEKVFTKFALRDQLELISKSSTYGGFELTTLPWKPDLIASAVRDLSNPIDAIVLPDDFTRGSELGITGDLYYWLNVDFLSVRGKTLILTGGISAGEGRIKEFLKALFAIHVEHASTSTEDDGLVVSKMSQIYDTSPYEKDTGVPAIFRPESMPKQLSWPTAVHEDPLDGHVFTASSRNSVEFMRPLHHGWPFAPYCVRAQSPESCDKLANAFFYWGNGAISWLGMTWEHDLLPLTEDWAVLLARSLRHGTCSEANRDGKRCAPLKKVLLIEPAAFTEQASGPPCRTADFIRNAADLLLDREGRIDAARVRAFLRGTRSLYTGNIGEPETELVDEETELMRDFLLRHALFYPKKGDVEIAFQGRASDAAGGVATLEYKFFASPLPGYANHTLFPPSEMVEVVGSEGNIQLLEERPLWEPHRLMVYMHELHFFRQLLLLMHLNSSISNDVNDFACIMTSHGKTCGRSFGAHPPLKIKEIVSDDFGVWMHPYKQGNRSRLLLNLPQSGLNSFFVKDNVGRDVDVVQRMHPRWKEVLRWALKQDLSGYTKLSSEELEKKADDMQIWVRLMHRYASLAVIADAAKLPTEKRQALGAIKAGLTKLLSGRFDNIFVYDTTLGGIVPCGCNRPHEGGACIPLPRVGLSEVEFPKGKDGRGGDVQAVLSLGNLCPALRYSSVEGGAGFFEGTQALFGYIIHMAAVVGLFDSEWLNTRLRLFTPTGIAAPKVHYVILSFILNIAAPDFFLPYADPQMRKTLHKRFTPYRHKDWWFLNSYDSSMQYLNPAGPFLSSPSESAFAYWAIGQYGKVTKDFNLQRWGELLAATELYSGNAFFRVKEWNTIYPRGVRYLGALGRLHESGAFFETTAGIEPHMIYTQQIIPITPFSLELLESGWSLFVQSLWQRSCSKNISKCIEEFGDIALAHLNVFVKKWTPVKEAFERERRIQEIVEATTQVTKVDCFQRKQFECGPHTLSNGVFFAAISQAVGGAHGILEAEDGNGRFRVRLHSCSLCRSFSSHLWISCFSLAENRSVCLLLLSIIVAQLALLGALYFQNLQLAGQVGELKAKSETFERLLEKSGDCKCPECPAADETLRASLASLHAKFESTAEKLNSGVSNVDKKISNYAKKFETLVGKAQKFLPLAGLNL